MKLYNTLTKTVEEILPQQPPIVTVYTCGPTVYDYAHIGHWFNYVRMDMLIRALKADGLQPHWVMNITDVGHLVSDGDEGEDKLEKGARREGKTAWEIAEYYTRDFLHGMQQLNITEPTNIVRATDHIAEQIALIERLASKGYIYIIDDGVYFDTSKFPRYGDFAGLDIEEQRAGARVQINPQKRNEADFALWKFSPSGFKRDMEWWSPWQRPNDDSSETHRVAEPRVVQSNSTQSPASAHLEPVHGSWGFPGWHIECSAMSMKYLGETIDIHTGGIDHIPVHHTNEIAQSEAATGKRFAKYWLHSNHIMIGDEKISKSLGNGIRLQDVLDRGYDAETFRILVLESNYRSQSKFSWDSLAAAKNRLADLRAMAVLRYQPKRTIDKPSFTYSDVAGELKNALTNDLATPAALAYLSDVCRQTAATLLEQSDMQAYGAMLSDIDALLGTNLYQLEDIDPDSKNMIARRDNARASGDWPLSDRLREELAKNGIMLRDTPLGTIWQYA